MSGFSAAWLALREPYDLAARNAKVLDAVAAHVIEQPSIGVVDLACGTGATLRAIGPHLPPQQSWRLVDNDLGLALQGPLDLITASALLDLVSAEWLDRLIVEAAARRLPVYAALTYDGRTTPEPGCVLDIEILAGFNAHQRTDKRSDRARRRARSSVSSNSATRSCRAGLTGFSGRTIGRSRTSFLPAGPRSRLSPPLYPRTRSNDGWRNGAAIWRRAARACASVTSTSSPGRSARAER